MKPRLACGIVQHKQHFIQAKHIEYKSYKPTNTKPWNHHPLPPPTTHHHYTHWQSETAQTTKSFNYLHQKPLNQ